MIGVIGGTGVTGSQVVAALKAKGADFKVIARDPDAAKAKLGVDCVQGDLSDPASLDAALEGVDTLYMVVGHSPNLETLETNGLEAAKRAGVSYLVYASGSTKGIRADSPSPVMVAHYNTEQKIKSSGLTYAIVQPNYFMSNLMMMADGIKNMGKMFGVLPSTTPVSMIHPADIGAATAEVILDKKYAGGSYYLAGKQVTFDDMAATLSSVLGKEVSYQQVPPEAMMKTMQERGMPDWLMAHLKGIMGIISQGGMSDESENVEKLTGNAPKTLTEWVTANRAAFE